MTAPTPSSDPRAALAGFVLALALIVLVFTPSMTVRALEAFGVLWLVPVIGGREGRRT